MCGDFSLHIVGMEILSNFLFDCLPLGSHSNSTTEWLGITRLKCFSSQSHSGMSSSCVASEQWSSTFTVEFNFSMFASLQCDDFQKLLFFYSCACMCMYLLVCMCSTCVQVPVENKRDCHILWNSSYRQLVVNCLICVLATKPGSICKSSKCP